MKWAQWYRQREAEKRHAAELGLPIPGTGRKHHGGPCPEGRCDWCKPRMRWVRSTENAAVLKEARLDG